LLLHRAHFLPSAAGRFVQVLGLQSGVKVIVQRFARQAMSVFHGTEVDSRRAEEIWSEYQRQHDLSEKTGQTAGIEPVTGRIWFGDSIQEVVAQRNADGSSAPLFFVRVGSAGYYRKGGRFS
jgi:hypothetical protein